MNLSSFGGNYQELCYSMRVLVQYWVMQLLYKVFSITNINNHQQLHFTVIQSHFTLDLSKITGVILGKRAVETGNSW